MMSSPFTRAELDLTDAAAVLAAARRCRPDVVINCAAYNDVEAAEDAAQTALTGNALAVAGARPRGSGRRRHAGSLRHRLRVRRREPIGPYTENRIPAARSAPTAMSKLLGEWFALEPPGAYVLRVESLFGGRPRQEQHRQDPASMIARASRSVCLRIEPSRQASSTMWRRATEQVIETAAGARRLSLRQQRRDDVAGDCGGDRPVAGPGRRARARSSPPTSN